MRDYSQRSGLVKGLATRDYSSSERLLIIIHGQVIHCHMVADACISLTVI